MAFNKALSNWFPGFSSDGTNISIPIASFPQLAAAEVDASTGDMRKFLWAFLDFFRGKWIGTAQADRPSKVAFSSGSTIDQTTLETVWTYTITVRTTTSALEVTDEPT
jgi:hypothetical protein